MTSQLERLRLDAYRNLGSSTLANIVKGVIVNRAFRVIATYRLAKHTSAWGVFGKILLPMVRLLHHFSQGAIGFELPIAVEAGGGLLVYHGWCLIINDKVRLGENVTLLHNVTIGANRRGAPVIGNGVTVATGSIIIGDIIIGDNATIGAGTLVTKDVAPNVVVVGNPCRVVRTKVM